MSVVPVLERIRQLPKTELHRHVDGAVGPRVLWDLLLKEGRELPQKNVQELADFLQIRPGMPVEEILAQFGLVISLMQTRENIEHVFYEQMHDLKRENIVYAELRFAPQYHLGLGLTLDQVTDAALSGIKRGEEDTGVTARILVCIARECTEAVSKEVVRSALRFEERGVVGIDLACNEAAFPPGRHLGAYRLTFGSLLGRTVHAGEFGPDRQRNISVALSHLRADRLGHAIELAYRPRDVAVCRDRRIGVEANPVSNLICGNIPDLRYLKLGELLREGTLVTLNSDDPELFRTSLSETIHIVSEAYGWSEDTIRELAANGIRSAFLGDSEKARLLEAHFS